jgi:crotonobetainyl-CoA:carnitine CoA-transferase CaiB-like acyl-CoA transferase
MLGYLAQLAFFTGQDPRPQGCEHPNLVPYGAFPAKDGSIIIACLTNSFWERICKALGRPEWFRDPRFETIEKRRNDRRVVNELISEITRQRTVQELVELFTEHEVPHAPILGIRDALAQPQTAAREMVVETEHPVLGKIPIVNRPVKFPGSPQPVPSAPPLLGQHTGEILQEILGLPPERIEALRASKVIG